MKAPASHTAARYRAMLVCILLLVVGAVCFSLSSFTGVAVVPATASTTATTSSCGPTVPESSVHPGRTVGTTTTTAPVVGSTGPTIRSRRVSRWHSTLSFRPANDEVDCDLVWRTLANLYEESKLRQAAWKEAGYPLPVTAPPGKNVTEIHLLMVGDSWARGSTVSVMRHLDYCRMRLPQPLIERDECALHHMGTGTYQFSKAALGFEHGASVEAAGILRVNIHFHWRHFLVEGAQHLETILRSTWPLPSILRRSFPRDAQCRDHPLAEVVEVEGQMPLCLCEDTLDLDDHFFRRVPVDAIQVANTMWDTHVPRVQADLFTFDDQRVDWFFRQKRFSPDPSVYPFMTWEDNVIRFREFLAGNYVSIFRGASGSASTPAGVPMPRVLLSVVPKGNCSARKFTYLPTLNSTQRCRELALPLHEATSDAVRAAYGEPLVGLPRSVPPEWLRLVDYRPLAATESPAHRNYTGASVAPGEYLCTLNDGTHFDTAISEKFAPPHYRWCARHADQLFWDNLRRKP